MVDAGCDAHRRTLRRVGGKALVPVRQELDVLVVTTDVAIIKPEPVAERVCEHLLVGVAGCPQQQPASDGHAV